MKKLLSILFSGMVVSCLPSHASAQFNYEKVSNKALETSVLIHMKGKIVDRQGKSHIIRGGCSGTFVSKNEILSAAHCFQNYTPINIWVRDINGKSYLAEVIKVDVKHDLSLLRVKGIDHKYSKLGTSLKVGEEIIVVGSPFNLEFLISHGIVSALHVEVEGLTSLYTITDAAINPGSSGGGMFNKEGYLVGVNTMTEGSPFGFSGITFSVSIEDIKYFLRK